MLGVRDEVSQRPIEHHSGTVESSFAGGASLPSLQPTDLPRKFANSIQCYSRLRWMGNSTVAADNITLFRPRRSALHKRRRRESRELCDAWIRESSPARTPDRSAKLD